MIELQRAVWNLTRSAAVEVQGAELVTHVGPFVIFKILLYEAYTAIVTRKC